MSTQRLVLSKQEDAGRYVRTLEEVWNKLDAQIRQTHTNLERLVEAKIRVEQELSSTGQSLRSDRQQVTVSELEHFQAVSREAS
jgi:hypothetical protein